MSTFNQPETEYTLSSIGNSLINHDPEARIRFKWMEIFLKEQLSRLSWHEEKYLEILFYLLLVKLQILSVETPEVKKYFLQFRTKIYSITKSILQESKGHGMQMRAFLEMVEYYLHTIEQLYRKLGISDRIMELYIIRMDVKQYGHLANRRMGAYLGLKFFRVISLYGTSLKRLTITCTLSLALFAWLYWMADALTSVDKRMITDLHDVSAYLFNSLCTITWLWLDARPVTWLQRLAMGINAMYGMIVMGMLFNVISTKLSMNK